MDNAGIPSMQLYSSPNLLTQEATITTSTKGTKSSSLRPPRRFTVVKRAKQDFERITSLPTNATINDRGMLVLGDIVDCTMNITRAKLLGSIKVLPSKLSTQIQNREQDPNLEPWHLHKFIPHAKGETLEVKTSKTGFFWPGKVLHIYENNHVNVLTSKGNVRVPPSMLRRVKTFELGEIGWASSDESEEYFIATVVKKHIDNTVDLHFHDGDRSEKVHPGKLQKWYRY